MKKHLLYILLNLFLLPSLVFCQQKKYTDITYINITDSILINNINKVIDIEVNNVNDSLFRRGLGYIQVSLKKFNANDTALIYYIAPQLMGLRKESINEAYPDYYSFINNRLIFININVLDKFSTRIHSEKNKKRIRKLLGKYLEKTTKLTLPDRNGKMLTDKQYRLDYLIFGGGFYLYIFKNNSFELKKDLYP